MSSSRDGEFKFTVDQMLGKLAKWLRLMGYDIFFPEGMLDDSMIIKMSKEQNRIIITRDYEVYIRYPLSIFEQHQDVDGQIYDFLDHFTFNMKNAFSRCPVCNGILKDYDGDMQKLPPYIRKNRHIYICTSCGKIYWDGSQYTKILEKLEGFQNYQKVKHA